MGKEKVVLRGKELEKYINLRKEISSQQALEKLVIPIKRQTNSVGMFIKIPQGQIPTQQVSLIAHRVGIKLPKKVLDNIVNMNVIFDSTPYTRLRKVIVSKLVNKKIGFSIKEIEEKFYQNIINFGFYDRNGKFLFSATTSIISKSQIKNLPRTLTPFDAIKLVGSNRQFIISRSVRKNTIKSLVAELDQSRNKILKEYITKYKQIPSPEKFKTLIDFSTERILRDKSKNIIRLTDLGFEQTLKKTTKVSTGFGRLSIEKRPILLSIKQKGINQQRLGVLEIIKSKKNIDRVIDSVYIPKNFEALGKQGFEAIKSRELFLKKLKTFSIKIEKQSKELFENFRKEVSSVKDYVEFNKVKNKFAGKLDELKILSKKTTNSAEKKVGELKLILKKGEQLKQVASVQAQVGANIPKVRGVKVVGLKSIAKEQARLKNIAKEQARLKNLSKSIIKTATKGLIKTATATAILSAIKSADVILVKIGELSKQKDKQKVIQSITPAYQQQLRIIQKQVQNIVLSPTIIPRVIPKPTPPKKIIEEIPILFKLPEGMPSSVRKQGGLYQGYEVAGRTPRRIMAITKYPASLNSSLSIATYFALHSRRGYAILTPSQKKVSKQVIDRPIRFGKDYYEKNKNKIVIVKKGRNVVIRRK